MPYSQKILKIVYYARTDLFFFDLCILGYYEVQLRTREEPASSVIYPSLDTNFCTEDRNNGSSHIIVTTHNSTWCHESETTI